MPSRTRPPARRSWSLASRFGASRPLRENPVGFGALSAFARTRVFHRDGRGRRQDAGRRAHVRAGDREAEDPETPPCEDGLSAASTAAGFSSTEATSGAAPPSRANASPPMPPRFRNASGSAPRGRDGGRLGPSSGRVKDYFLKNKRRRSGANPLPLC